MAKNNYTRLSNVELISIVQKLNISQNHLSRILKKQHEDIFFEILQRTQFLLDDVPIKARLYCLENNIMVHPICKNPGCNNKVKWKDSTTGFCKYCCKQCKFYDPDFWANIKETMLAEYGFDHPMRCDEIKERLIKTNIERYGVKYTCQSDIVQNKMKEHFIEKYGVTNPFQSDVIKSKIKQTLMNKYGVEYISQSDEIRNKVKNTCMKRYGVENVSQVDDVKKKIIQTRSRNFPVGIVKSKPEIELGNFIQSICECDIEFNCRSILSDDKELDIYVPSKKLAIEFNGDYWHMNPRLYDESYYNSQSQCTAKEKWEYDKLKQEECQDLGIKLIVVWEYDWIHSRTDVEAMLRNEFTD